MALSGFFRINMPYGIKRNSSDEWFTFNSKYRPLGWNTTKDSQSIMKDDAYAEMSVYTKYVGLTEAKLLKLAHSPDGILRDGGGKINTIFCITILQALHPTPYTGTDILRR